MDSDPPPRSPQTSPRRGSVEVIPPQPPPWDRWAGQRLPNQSPMPQQGSSEAEASQPAHLAELADRQDLPLSGVGYQQVGSSSPVPESPGLGLAAPVIGSLIGLLTLVVPLFAVLDDRPGHPLPQPLSRHLPVLDPARVSPGAP